MRWAVQVARTELGKQLNLGRKIRREEKTQIILKCILKHNSERMNVQQEAQE
jgi:hypothetical protein